MKTAIYQPGGTCCFSPSPCPLSRGAVSDYTKEAPKRAVNHPPLYVSLCRLQEKRAEEVTLWPPRQGPRQPQLLPAFLDICLMGHWHPYKEPDSPVSLCWRCSPLQVPACTPQLSCWPNEWVTMDMQPDWALSDSDPACHLSAVTGEPPKKELLTCFLPNGFTKPWARENGGFTTPPSVNVMCHTAVVSGKYQCMCVHVHVPAWVCMYTRVEWVEAQAPRARCPGWEECHRLCDLPELLTLSEPHLLPARGQWQQESPPYGVMEINVSLSVKHFEQLSLSHKYIFLYQSEY